MSLLKIGGIQLGQSNTASNNFHWRNLLDGLLRLSRGNAGSPITDVMTVNPDNSVSFPGSVAAGVLGAGQTWQDVTGSRAFGTTYTNTTGRPILVCVTGLGTASAGNAGNMIVSGVTVGVFGNYGTNSYSCGTFIVPAGSTYSATNAFNMNLSRWCELR